MADDPTRPVHHPYPVGLVVAGRRCLLVGGGRIAARRLPALLEAGADVFVVAPEVTDAVREHAEAGRITWRDRGFVPEDLDGVWLALTATGDVAVDAAVAAAATERRV